jgi:exopolyphosphatase/guanosine-5'-triphosphate,3'-diphosphate pyrophosphatase
MRDEGVLVAQSVGTRLGARLDERGNLDPAARERTLATIRDYVETVRADGATLDVIATSAMRRAHDAPAFVADVHALTQVEPRIISGEEEARYSFLGATASLHISGPLGVLDVGGGSTELAVGTRERIEAAISLEIGAVRLSERHPALLGAHALVPAEREDLAQRARADAAKVLAPLADLRGFAELVAVGGTAYTAAAMLACDATRDGVSMNCEERRKLVDDLLARTLEERRALPFIRPQRADILPAGLLIIDEACAHLAIDTVRVSHHDLLAGYLQSPAYRGA